jgi:hypothetical protein
MDFFGSQRASHTQQSRCAVHMAVLLLKLEALCSDCFVSGRLQCEYCYYTTYMLTGSRKLILVARVPIWAARRALFAASYRYQKYAVNTARHLFKTYTIV